MEDKQASLLVALLGKALSKISSHEVVDWWLVNSRRADYAFLALIKKEDEYSDGSALWHDCSLIIEVAQPNTTHANA